MKTQIKYFIPAICLLGLFVTTSAFAQNASTTARINELKAKVASTTEQSISKMIAQSDKEITQRINSLNALTTRVQAVKKISDSNKTSILSEIQTEINNLNTLKTKIDADTDAAVLKTDLKSITDNFRIYILIMPQIQIIAAADRVAMIITDFSGIATKLQMRVNQAQAAGKDIPNIQMILNDVQTKINDAQTQAQNAINAVASLTPDQGNQSAAQANTAALKQARSFIKTATADLQTARKDADNILKTIQAFHLKNTTATSTATSTHN